MYHVDKNHYNSTVIDLIKVPFTNWFCGVMASTLDFESKDPSSNLGRTFQRWKFQSFLKIVQRIL